MKTRKTIKTPESNPPLVNYSDLSRGDTFMQKATGYVYLKLDDNAAVNLSTGIITSANTNVIPVDLDAVVTFNHDHYKTAGL